MRCYVCECYSQLTMRTFIVETLAPEDGMVEQNLVLPVCADPDICEKNVIRVESMKKDKW